MSIEIVLADDCDAIRHAQRCILELETDWVVVGEAQNGREAIELVNELEPDVVVMDINMPNVDGITATRVLHQLHPNIRVVACSSHCSKAVVMSMLRAGASGYVLKGSAGYELGKAIRAVLEGGIYIDPEIRSDFTTLDLEVSSPSNVVT